MSVAISRLMPVPRARRRFAGCVMLGLLGVAGAACGGDDDGSDAASPPVGSPASRSDIAQASWLLDWADSSLIATSDESVTLNVDSDSDAASGTGPCNVYGARFTVDGDALSITDITSTLRACEEPIMAAENEYFDALEAVDRARLDAAGLVLDSDDGVRLSFTSFGTADALIGTWSIVNVTTGDALESIVDGTEPSVTFTDDGNIELDAGCNTGSSTWELRDDALVIAPFRLTLMLCDTPAGVMEQEAAIVSALEAATEVEGAPGKVTLLAADGTIALIAVGAT